MKNIIAQWAALISIGAVVVGVAFAGGELKEKVATIEQVQVENASLRKDMMKFIMDLWKIDPEQQHKWKELPKWPTKTSDSVKEGYRFNGMESLVYYKEVNQGDSLLLYIDTLYVQKKDSL